MKETPPPSSSASFSPNRVRAKRHTSPAAPHRPSRAPAQALRGAPALVDGTSPQSESISVESENGGQDALTLLRSETALSRFPLHRLTKGKSIGIEVYNPAAAVLWRVDHNSRYGPPGALAYKLDSLLINRRIEAARRPVPKLIRLGSLREIAEEMGSGNNTGTVKRALLQNATASITAKISYRTRSEGERRLETVFNRYSVIFTGEQLPQGDAADAVYLLLNDIYQDILNTAVFRPLDYDYMKSLPPISQRFYEIVSYQMYAAVRHRNPCARLLYSQYCALSTATRYPDFDHVKKQMYKVLRPHIASGYIAKVEYERVVSTETDTHTGTSGERDWWMCYTPGPSASREYQIVNRRTGKRWGTPHFQKSKKAGADGRGRGQNPSHSGPPPSSPAINPSTPEDSPRATPEDSELVEALVAADLNRVDAKRLTGTVPQVCRRQLAFLPFVKEFTTSRGAYLRRAIEGDFGPPQGYTREQKQQPENPSHNLEAKESAPTLSQEARQSHEECWKEAFAAFVGEWLAKLQNARPEAFAAFGAWEEQKRQQLQSGPLAKGRFARRALESFDQPFLRADRVGEFCRGQGAHFRLTPPSFWEWDETFNATPLRPGPTSVIP